MVSKHQKELSKMKKDTNSNVNDFALHELDYGPEIEESAILKYKELYKILHNMIDLCVTEVNNVKKPRRNDQRLLRNMAVHNIVLDLTKISYEKQEDKRMHIVMKAAHEFLQNFCFANPHNQSLLHEKLDFSRFPENEWEAETATFIYRDNTVLCNEISERLIQNFVHALEHQNEGGSKVSYLKFLQTISICDGHEIKKCQDIIMTEIMNSDIMNFTSDKTHIDDLIHLMEKSQSTTLHDESNNEINNQINFQINLIQLLSNCTAGKNTFTEIKCHSILPLEDIEKVVLNKNCMIEVKDAYISFLYHCHIDTENETKEIFTTPFIWNIFENFVQDMSLVCPSRVEREYADRLLEKYVGNTIIDVISGFFSHNQFPQIPSPNTRADMFQTLYSKLNQLHRCNWLTEVQKANINLAIVTMQEKASFMGIVDIPRLEGTSISENRVLSVRTPVQPTVLQKIASTASSFPRNRLSSVVGLVGNTNELMHKFRSSMPKISNFETLKQDTRLVNEAFQVIILKK